MEVKTNQIWGHCSACHHDNNTVQSCTSINFKKCGLLPSIQFTV